MSPWPQVASLAGAAQIGIRRDAEARRLVPHSCRRVYKSQEQCYAYLILFKVPG